LDKKEFRCFTANSLSHYLQLARQRVNATERKTPHGTARTCVGTPQADHLRLGRNQTRRVRERERERERERNLFANKK